VREGGRRHREQRDGGDDEHLVAPANGGPTLDHGFLLPKLDRTRGENEVPTARRGGAVCATSSSVLDEHPTAQTKLSTWGHLRRLYS